MHYYFPAIFKHRLIRQKNPHKLYLHFIRLGQFCFLRGILTAAISAVGMQYDGGNCGGR